MLDKRFSSLFVIAIVILVSCKNSTAPSPTVSTGDDSEHSFVIGAVSDSSSATTASTQPLADYLADQLQDYGISEGKVLVAESIDEMARLMANSEVDLYIDSVYPAMLVSESSGATPILRVWRYGVVEYHSVIFASADSGIRTLADLPGHMIAMDMQYSTAGFMLPAVYMAKNGLLLSGKSDFNAPVEPNEVGFVFSDSDENTLQWVLSGYTAAGVTDDYHFDVTYPLETTQKLIVLARTESTSRQIVVASLGMDSQLLAAAKKILIGMHETDAGKAALESFQASKFDVFPEGAEAATRRLREMKTIAQGITLP